MNLDDIWRNFNPKKIPWWLIAGLFVFASPLGFIALLLKLFGGGQSTAVNEPSLQQYAPMQLPTEKVDTRINKPKYAPQDSSRHITIPPAPKKIHTGWMKAVGAITAFFAFLDIGTEVTPVNVGGLLTAIAFLLGGLALAAKGFLSDKDQKRYAAYLPIIGQREAVDVEELSRISGASEKRVRKDLQEMLELNYFGSGAYLNQELGYLFKSSQADLEWREQHQDELEDIPDEANEGYSGILRDIRRANDKIADPVLSEKIDRLEAIVGRILRVMEEDPEKAKRMDTFMTYYLPTTQKLLDSYAKFEAAGVEGENLSESKKRIASTMDMLIQGFSHQLDALYKSDAMDIDSDIRVMETMLKRDTGGASDDFGFGGSAAQKAPWDKR